ncbi:hypothetical protein [Chlorobium sp.]|uniref:hypothetical protein n=1 Tax=Chlorobium sp. TaxID=1095 RepID=UPI002F3F9026
MKHVRSLFLPAVFMLITGIAQADIFFFRDASGKTRSEEVFTPAPGSVERKAILDVMRMKVRELHELDVVFVVKSMKVCEGWAWVHTQPRSMDGNSRYEDFYALLQRVKGTWTIVEIPCTEPDDPACMDSSGYFGKLSSRFPGLPAVILPSKGKRHE